MGGTGPPGAAGPADPVDVEFIALGKIEVVDCVYTGNIDAPGCHICGHQNPDLPIPKLLKCLFPNGLLNVPMDGLAGYVPHFQQPREPVGHVFGVAELTRQILPYMGKGGHIVNISSMGGVQGSMKFAGLSAYSSSKGALITLTELLAEEYKDSGIAFNVLALGAVQTEMLAEAFPGYEAPMSSENMASYILDFALNGNKYYNGKLLQVSNSTP